jgi:hypothetical protein
MKVHGSCHCGSVRYEAEIDPARVTICHCTDCQALTGSAYRVSVAVVKDDFVLQAGAPTIYVKTAESGARRAQAFCGKCGSPLYTHAADDPSSYGLRVGCIDERRLLTPTKQVWCRSALPWSMDIEALPRHEKERGG